MDDRRTIPLTTVAASVAWAWTTIAAIGAVVLRAVGHDDLAFTLGITVVVSVGLAVSLTGQCLAIRVMRLIRSLNGTKAPDSPAGLYSIDS